MAARWTWSAGPPPSSRLGLPRTTCSVTIHRVRVAAGVDVDMLCASMVNSLTFAWAEVCGRSYGGGVLELEPREAERLLIPYRFSAGIDVEYVDQRLRAGDLEGALDHGDRALLKDGCGFFRPGRDARRMEQTTIKAPSTKIERRCVGRTCPFSLTNPRHVLSPAQVERRSATVYVYEVSDTRIANG